MSEEPKEAAPAAANDAPSEAPDIDSALEGLDPGLLDQFEFVINPDGSVTFVDFPPELVDIAYALNPDDPLVCERRDLISAAAEAEPEPEG